MALDIQLKIYMPEKLVLDTKTYRVILPSNPMPLTVIKGRAPTLMTLDMGALKILDESNRVIDEWLISVGSADIKEDSCTVLTESAFRKSDLNLDLTRQLYQDFPNPYYKWLVDYFEHEKLVK